jgi:hypothetical protein
MTPIHRTILLRCLIPLLGGGTGRGELRPRNEGAFLKFDAKVVPNRFAVRQKDQCCFRKAGRLIREV